MCVPTEAQPAYFLFDQQHPERFELIAVDSEFFLCNSITDLKTRQPHWKSLGFVENRNRYLTEEQFGELLSRGNETRRQIYSGSL
jgi:hypothetical protein